MWLFIISDAVTFGAILFGYAYLRIGTPNWSTPFHFSPNIVNGLIMTFVLLSSSLTMLAADAAARQGRKSSCLQWLGATVVTGIVLRCSTFANGSTCSTTDGACPKIRWADLCSSALLFQHHRLHLMHVISGVIALIVIAIGYNTDWLDAGHVETTGLYWHFVDLVWMFVFPLLYLMNVAR